MAHGVRTGGLRDTALKVQEAVTDISEAVKSLEVAMQTVPEQFSQIEDQMESFQLRIDERLNRAEQRMEQVMEERWKLLEDRLEEFILQKVEEAVKVRIDNSLGALPKINSKGDSEKGSHENNRKEVIVGAAQLIEKKSIGLGNVLKTEARLNALEASLSKALQHMFPRVEAVLAKLEETSSASSLPDPNFLQFDSTKCNFTFPDSSECTFPFSSPSQFPSPSICPMVPDQPAFLPLCSNINPNFFVTETDRTDPLIIAAKDGKICDVEDLLNNGTNVNVKDIFGNTALYWAAFRGYVEILCLLVRRGANINCRNNLGWSPLHAASRWGLTTCISLLLDAGAEIDCRTVDGKTPLHVAASSGREKSVETLLIEGAQINAVDNIGRTPMDLASSVAVHRLLCS